MIKRLLYLSLSILIFMSKDLVGHAMVCIDSSMVPSPEPIGLKCMYHYVYITNDNRRCYIRFTLGGGINLVPQSSLGINDLGNIAIKADILGIQEQSNQKSPMLGTTLANLQRKGFQPFTRFTMSQRGIPLALTFEPDAVPMANVRRLYNRDSVPGNMSLEQLQAVIGKGNVADNLDDLYRKMQYMKISGCTVDM